MSEKITLSQARQKALDSCKKRPAVDDKDDYCCNCVELQAELDDYHNAEKFVADPPHDEICCGCVSLKKVQAENVAKDKALVYAIRFLDPEKCDRDFVMQALKGGERKDV